MLFLACIYMYVSWFCMYPPIEFYPWYYLSCLLLLLLLLLFLWSSLPLNNLSGPDLLSFSSISSIFRRCPTSLHSCTMEYSTIQNPKVFFFLTHQDNFVRPTPQFFEKIWIIRNSEFWKHGRRRNPIMVGWVVIQSSANVKCWSKMALVTLQWSRQTR